VDPRAGLNAAVKKKIPSSCRESNPDRSARSFIPSFGLVKWLNNGMSLCECVGGLT